MTDKDEKVQPTSKRGQNTPGSEQDRVEDVNHAENRDAGEAEAALEEAVHSLRAEAEENQKKAEEYLDGWQRARAEFANYKKRVERDQAQVYQQAVGSIARRYLEILDDLERALKNRPQEGEGATWAEGIELIYKKFKSFLEAEGVVQLEAEGEQFDPNFHEAITQEDSREHESGQIIEVVQQGYMMGERVLRPALVRVAR
jgi:molecular chaperone GrpE